MKALPGKSYAIIQDGIVTKIFDNSEIEEWNEENIFVVPMSPEDDGWVMPGDRYDYDKKRFIEPPLESAKYQQELYINNRFDEEISLFKAEFIPPDELMTWSIQAQEAEKYLQTLNPQDAPNISLIAAQRNESLDSLAEKIIKKNKSYNEKLFTLIGYKQKLLKQLELAQDLQEISAVEYISPYGFK